MPEILSHGYKNINSSPDRKALPGSSNKIFMLYAIAQNFLSAIYHRRVFKPFSNLLKPLSNLPRPISNSLRPLYDLLRP
ncbi:MAG: hypothetical protein WAT71_01635 [Ignavibacteria bacterium]